MRADLGHERKQHCLDRSLTQAKDIHMQTVWRQPLCQVGTVWLRLRIDSETGRWLAMDRWIDGSLEGLLRYPH